MERAKPTPTDLILIGAGAVMLVGSFLDFSGDTNAWGTGWLPIVTLIPIYGLLMAVPVALSKLAGVKLPDLVFGFTWAQINAVLAVFAVLMSAGWLVNSDDAGPGLWLMLIGSAGALYGSLAPLIGSSEAQA
ncbi:MAG: hypothetical protein M5T61_08375 [Acidimicrobiia bacterium]|nr:hypothetical protein [Acidimicrobiia bacterium]